MLIISETTKDFGNIIYNTPVSVSFNVTNNESTPSKKISLGASCGCTTPVLSHNPIPANTTALLTITYNANNRGKNFKIAWLMEEGQPKVEFDIIANVI